MLTRKAKIVCKSNLFTHNPQLFTQPVITYDLLYPKIDQMEVDNFFVWDCFKIKGYLVQNQLPRNNSRTTTSFLTKFILEICAKISFQLCRKWLCDGSFKVNCALMKSYWSFVVFCGLFSSPIYKMVMKKKLKRLFEYRIEFLFFAKYTSKYFFFQNQQHNKQNNTVVGIFSVMFTM